MKTINKYYLKNEMYYQQESKKTQIVLHHTVSKTWKSAFNWWNRQKYKIATAYIVDKDGEIYEVFNPKHWAYHTGTGAKYDKHSIGIELVNEGYVDKVNEKMKWFDGRYTFTGKYETLQVPFRGHKYFAKYTQEQIDSTFVLVEYLCNKFKIKKQVAPDLEFNNLYLEYNGIITHANIKDTKTDVSPLFPLKKLEEYLQVIPTTIATPKDEKKENMSFITIILNLFITLFKKK